MTLQHQRETALAAVFNEALRDFMETYPDTPLQAVMFALDDAKADAPHVMAKAQMETA